MFHIIWAILFIIKLYKSVANAPSLDKGSLTSNLNFALNIL